MDSFSGSLTFSLSVRLSLALSASFTAALASPIFPCEVEEYQRASERFQLSLSFSLAPTLSLSPSSPPRFVLLCEVE